MKRLLFVLCFIMTISLVGCEKKTSQNNQNVAKEISKGVQKEDATEDDSIEQVETIEMPKVIDSNYLEAKYEEDLKRDNDTENFNFHFAEPGTLVTAEMIQNNKKAILETFNCLCGSKSIDFSNIKDRTVMDEFAPYDSLFLDEEGKYPVLLISNDSLRDEGATTHSYLAELEPRVTIDKQIKLRTLERVN